MKKNPLVQLKALGQSVWLDYIRRDLLTSGELRRCLKEDGVRGLTSNPAIFEKALAEGHDYDAAIRTLLFDGKGTSAIYESLSQFDIQGAADEFLPLYEKTEGRDGYVSLEVNPHLAHDTSGTVEEARRLWGLLDRPNVLIKVPATIEGLPAVQQLVREGINVNVTLIFGLTRYRQVAEAYIAGIEERLAAGGSVQRVASVASFFVSRIDTLVDSLLESILKQGSTEADLAREVVGQVAIASAKLAYQNYKELFSTVHFTQLAAAGARTQRLLWASTGSKNPNYSDLKYVESLIGPDTINTLPPETLKAFRQHGVARITLEAELAEAAQAMSRLAPLGIVLDKVTQQLEDEGVEKFTLAFDQLLAGLAKARPESVPERP